MTARRLPWVELVEGPEARLTIDLALYALESVKQTAYWFTGRCYVHLEPTVTGGEVVVRIVPVDSSVDLNALVGEFGNRLLDEDLRRQIGSETRPIRELIVGQAFAEADLPEAEPSSPANDAFKPHA